MLASFFVNASVEARTDLVKGLLDVSTTNKMRDLCDGCFKWCGSLHYVTVGSSVSLRCGSIDCFEG